MEIVKFKGGNTYNLFIVFLDGTGTITFEDGSIVTHAEVSDGLNGTFELVPISGERAYFVIQESASVIWVSLTTNNTFGEINFGGGSSIDDYLVSMSESDTDEGIKQYIVTDNSGNETLITDGFLNAVQFGTGSTLTQTLMSRDNQTNYSFLLATSEAVKAIEGYSELESTVSEYSETIDSMETQLSEIMDLLTIGSDSEMSQPVMTVNSEAPDSDGNVDISTSDIPVDE